MPPTRIPLWPAAMPGPTGGDGDERDTSGPNDGKVAGKSVVRLTGVGAPSVEVHLPTARKRTGAGVVICPGGGFHILAMDLEGTEVAAWLNGIGVAAFVLRYRVPTAGQPAPWLAPAIDTQRALRLARSQARAFGIADDRLGVLGFSAGGKTAAVAAARAGRALYDPVDAVDRHSARPDFAALIYSAYLVDEKGDALAESAFGKDAPPIFLAHAADDPIPVGNAVGAFTALRAAGVPAELHVWETGGHGYGLRPVASQPVTTWPQRCEEWMRRRGLLSKGS